MAGTLTVEGIDKYEAFDKDLQPYWVWKVKICNEINTPQDIKLADNPWMGTTPSGTYTDKLFQGGGNDEDRKKALANWINPDDHTNGPVTLAPKGTPGACTELCIAYRNEPSATYLDVFVRGADGTYSWPGAGYSHAWQDIVWRKSPSIWSGIFNVVTMPLWYPMALEAVWSGPASFVIDKIEGLPQNAEVVGTIPAIGVAQELEPGNRKSECALVLRRTGTTYGRHTVKVHFRVADPPDLREFPEHVFSFDIVGEPEGEVPTLPGPIFARTPEAIGPGLRRR